MIFLVIFLVLFLIIGIGIIVLQRLLIDKLNFSLLNISYWIEDLKEVTNDYKNHLDTFNSMETYTGEPVVEDLIKHSKFVVERINEINNSLEYKENNQGGERKELEQ